MNLFFSLRYRSYFIFRFLFSMIVAIIIFPIVHYFHLPQEYFWAAVLVGILISILLFPSPAETIFRNAVIPILQAYERYLCAIRGVIYQDNPLPNLQQKRLQVENVLRTSPEWVYLKGYHARLREGHRHFLLRVEQMGEVLFSMHAITRQKLNKKILKKIRKKIYFIIDQTAILLLSMTDALALQKPKFIIDDWFNELEAVEKIFYECVPQNFEMLEAHKHNIYLAAFIEDLKDFRYFLLKCAQAVR